MKDREETKTHCPWQTVELLSWKRFYLPRLSKHLHPLRLVRLVSITLTTFFFFLHSPFYSPSGCFIISSSLPLLPFCLRLQYGLNQCHCFLTLTLYFGRAGASSPGFLTLTCFKDNYIVKMLKMGKIRALQAKRGKKHFRGKKSHNLKI